MNKRIKEIRKYFDMSQADFGEKIGMKKNSLSQIETGKNSVTEQVIKSICREFNVDYIWLTTGEGEMFKKRSKSQEIGAFANDIMDLPDENFKKRFISALTNLDEKDWAVLMKIADKLNKED